MKDELLGGGGGCGKQPFEDSPQKKNLCILQERKTESPKVGGREGDVGKGETLHKSGKKTDTGR